MHTATAPGLVLALGEGTAPLQQVGGKGVSLALMVMAGLPVPPGFILTTAAYERCVAENGLKSAIAAAVAGLSEADPSSWDRAASVLHARFEQATVPADVAAAVRQAYRSLTGAGQTEAGRASLAVAVRSSATAEDLPGASFAGQQETFLNMRGETAVLDAVRRCWASLWTARALAYRHRLSIDHHTVMMAVVVQVLIPAEAAGVLFTANPTTGERAELLVNASYGLGEAVVSGQVTPDTFVVDRQTLGITTTVLGSKDVMISPMPGVGGGTDGSAQLGQGTKTEMVPAHRRNEPAVSAAALHDVCALALEVEQLFAGVPQDIEWAVARGRCWLLQARPITGLPPAPLLDVRWEPPVPGSKWIRRQVVEHMPEPLSPLFEELYLGDGLERSIDRVFETLHVPGAMSSFINRPIFGTVNGFAYQRADVRLGWSGTLALLRVTRTSIPVLFRESVPNWRDQELPEYLAAIEPWKALDPSQEPDDRLLTGIRALAAADARYWFAAALAIGTAKVTDALLDTFLRQAAPGRRLGSGRFLQALSRRGMAADVALEQVAALVRGSEPLRHLIASIPPQQFREALASNQDGAPVLAALDTYFEQFGHLIYSLDFAMPTQADDPLPVLVALRALTERPGRDADARFAELARQRDALSKSTARSFDPIRRRLFRTLLGWARRYAPYREEALFFVGAAWPTLRRLAVVLGQRLTDARCLEQPDDVFYLQSSELAAASAARAAGTARPDLARLAQERRQLREARKRLVAPPAVPPDYQFTLGPIDLSARESVRRNTADDRELQGFAVSAGRVTAPASLILSAADFATMQPGTVLVCPTTTPAWTPLFSQALALVTDIGGILAHGSIVAREYGIPAVMGTGTATQRIRSGQPVTVDGDAGTVILHA